MSLLAIPGFASAAISVTPIFQQRFDNNSTAAQTTSSFTPGSNVLLVVAVTFYETGNHDGSGAPTITLSDSRGLNWTSRLAAEYDSVLSFPTGTRIFTAPAGASASMTLTVDVSQALYEADTWDVQVFQVRGYDEASPVGLTAASGMDMAGTSLALGGTTAASSVTLALGLTDNTASLTINPGSGWSEHYDTYTYPTQAQSQTKSGAISSADWTTFATGAYSKWAVALELKAGTAGILSAMHKPPNNLGLIGYWNFDDGTGTKATDFSGNRNVGTLTDGGNGLPSWVNGKAGRALAFSAAQSWVTMGDINAMDGLSRITVSAWVKSSSPGINTGEGHIIDKSDCTGAAGDGPFELYTADGDHMTFTIYNAGSPLHSGASITDVNDGKWHFLTGVYDGTDVSIWVDGVRETSANYPGETMPSTARPVALNGYCNGSNFWWSGSTDEVRVYNRALTSSEIQRLYKSVASKIGASSAAQQKGTSLSSGLVGHWTFDGPNMTDKVYDSSENNSHAYLDINAYIDGNSTSSIKTIGKLGQAVSLIGIDGYIYAPNSTPYSFERTQPFTIALWLYPTGHSRVAVPVEKTDGSKGYNLEINSTNTDSITLYLFNSTQSATAYTDAGTLPLNTWSHVTATYNGNSLGSGITIYINGESKSVTTAGLGLATTIINSGNLTLGGTSQGGTTVEGKLDDVRIYNRVLTAAEAKQLYNLGSGKIKR